MKFIKKHWAILLLAATVLFLGLSNLIDRHSFDTTGTNIAQVDINTIRSKIIDSMRSIQSVKEIGRLDSINKVHKKEVTVLQKEVRTLKEKLAQEIVDYTEDTIQSDPCDSIILTSQRIISGLDEEVRIIGAINKNLELKIIVKDSAYVQRTLYLNNVIDANYKLKKEIKRQTTWWKRNDKWFYMASGAILTFLIVK